MKPLRTICLSAVTILLQCCFAVADEPPGFVTLVDAGRQKCCFIEFVPLTSAERVLISDGNAATEFSFTSLRGEPIPEQTLGISEVFTFDVSKYASISDITFTWTGTYEWTAGLINPFPSMRIGVQPVSDYINILGFDSNELSTGNVVTGTRIFTGTSIADMTSGGLASIQSRSTRAFHIDAFGHQFYQFWTIEKACPTSGT
jgi:hypothetical protein